MDKKKRRQRGRARNNAGSIQIVEREGGKSYYGWVTVAPYDRRRVSARDEKALERKMLELKHKAATGTLEQPNRHTVASWLEFWIDDVIRPNRRETTTQLYRAQIRNHIVPYIGSLKLTTLAPMHLQGLYARLEREHRSPRMRQHVHGRLYTALKRAKKLRLIPSNPAEDVDVPTAAKRPMATFDRHQVRAFLEAARGDRYEALYVLAITTGMRQGELLGLQWQDVDLDAAALVVQHSLGREDGELKLLKPKTATSRRRIDLSAVAVDALREHRERTGSLMGSHFVFSAEGRGPVRKENLVRRSFQPILERAGLPRIRFHDLRHTSASLLLASGASVKVAQERLGHARASITLDVYAHTVRTMQREAAEFFDELLS